MNEEKRIKRVLLRNTLLFFIVFGLIFGALGIFTYSAVRENMYRSADKQLTSILSAYPIVSENTAGLAESTMSDQTGNVEGTAASSESLSFDKSITDDQSAATLLSTSTIEENLQDNPQTIYMFRNADGTLGGMMNLYPGYSETFSDFPFDADKVGTIYDIEFNGHTYRSVTQIMQIQFTSTAITTTDGVTISNAVPDAGNSSEVEGASDAETSATTWQYLQMVVNVDSEIAMLEQFTQTLVIGLTLALVVCAAASYLLSRKTTKPIMQAWKKQTEFVQNASHELRTPLTVIHTTQELMLESPEGKIIDHFEDISLTLEETGRLSKLAEELLLLTSIDSGKTELDKQSFELDPFVEDTATLYEDYAASQNKSLVLDLAFGRSIEADRDRIRQVLSALIDNAVKYTEEGDTITLCTRDAGKSVVITVSDTGIGIADEDQDRLFDRFYRADKARTRTGNGVGLGLSISSSIIEAHGGTIVIGRNEPKGTVVAIDLPA